MASLFRVGDFHPHWVPLEGFRDVFSSSSFSFARLFLAHRRAFNIDLESCPRCAGKLRFLALLTEPAVLERLLRHIGESSTPPTLAPARAPPYVSGSVARIKQPPDHWDAA